MGPTCPQVPFPVPLWWTDPEPPGTVQNEDCLVLNVWTAGLSSERRRPVMVWLHGGGFSTGSGSVLLYDGTNLAKTGDVVVATLNHRLNVFGFLCLGAFSDKYAEAANVGMLDIILALEWVRDNIANFGGDPGNVTIFGESGGGQKVGTLMAMPAAKGLFHKAIQQSGPCISAVDRDFASGVARDVLRHFALRPDQIDELQQIPVAELLNIPAEIYGTAGLKVGPVAGTPSLPAPPFAPNGPAPIMDVPLIIGTNLNESLPLTTLGVDIGSFDDAALCAEFEKLGAGAHAERIIATYRATRPDVSSYGIYLAALGTDTFVRLPSITQADHLLRHGKQPVYMYIFAWQSPAPGMRAAHGAELPFVFGNLDAAPLLTGNGPERDAIGDALVRAWTHFAHTGEPRAERLPAWPRYDSTTRATLVVDHESTIVNDPGREERLALTEAGLDRWSSNDLYKALPCKR